MQLQRALAPIRTLAVHGDPTIEVTGVAYDSRLVRPGDIYACVRGERADGHDFANDAVARGASALIVDHMLENVRTVAPETTQVVVASTRSAMATVAHELFGRPSEHLHLAGVTGTNGKTTVTYLIEAIAAAAGLTSGRIGTLGARIAGQDVPLTRTTPEGPDFHALLAAMVGARVNVAAVEVSSHALALGRVDGAQFSVAGFTHLTRDHLDFHHDMESYFEVKARLFTPERSAAAVVTIDDGWGTRLARRHPDTWTASVSSRADVAVETMTIGSDVTKLRLATPAGPTEIVSNLAGPFNAANVVLAAGLALRMQLPLESIGAGIETVRTVPGRFEPVSVIGCHARVPRVIVDYAHTPGGVQSVLAAARAVSPPGTKVVIVLGAGGDRDMAKRDPMGEAAGRGADVVVITSDNPRSEDPATIAAAVARGVARTATPFIIELDRRRGIGAGIAEAGPDGLLIVAGKGHETGQDIGGAVSPFDDRAVVREELLTFAEHGGPPEPVPA